jgi:tripartite-type tricarboxylate transporter receptor subunit TctC
LTILLIGGEAIAAAQLFEEPGVNFDINKQIFLGRVSAENKVVLLGPKSPFKTIGEMIASERPVLWAGSGKTDGNTDFSAILSYATGMKSKMIIGYKGTGGMTLAMETGEVDGRVLTDESATLFNPATGMRVVASLARQRAQPFPDAPTIFEAAKMTASGEKYLDWRADLAGLGRIILAAPGTPPDRVALLRTTLGEIINDPVFVAETKKFGLSVSYADGDAVGAMVRKVMTGLDARSLAEIKDITLNRYY